jgi:hypothetical protein
MTAIATEKTNTILFPLPLDFLKAFVDLSTQAKNK